MRIHRRWPFAVALLFAALFAVPAAAQQTPAPQAGSPTAPPKPKLKPTPKPVARPAAAKPATPPAMAAAGGVQPRLLGQYGDWGAYTALPAGRKVCFVISKPTSSQTNPPNRPRNPTYMFVSTRPTDKVANEVSVVIGYPFKPNSDASADVGSTSFALYTQLDGGWIKNAADEAHMVDAMRAGQTAVVKGVSAKGTQSTDVFTLRGLSQALDRIAQECK